jgi:hypothetical protein
MKNRILSMTRNSIPYVGFLRELDLVNSVTDCIVMQQLDYWFAKYPDGFYKFLEPCDHSLYRDGDSWTEELFISHKEFRTAFSNLGVAYKTKTDFLKQDNPFRNKYYCSYYDRITHRTYYFRNHQKVDEALELLTCGVKKEKELKAPESKSFASRLIEKLGNCSMGILATSQEVVEHLPDGKLGDCPMGSSILCTEINTNINPEISSEWGEEAHATQNNYKSNFCTEEIKTGVVDHPPKPEVSKPIVKSAAVSCDGGWGEFAWLEELYQQHKPSCWKATWAIQSAEVLRHLKASLNKLNGDVVSLKQMIVQAFARVQNKPSLWDYSMEWVLRPSNLESLAWEGASNLYAPSHKTEQQMKVALERQMEWENSRSLLEKLGYVV